MGEGQNWVDGFLRACEKEAPKLSRSLARIDGHGKRVLDTILRRFDCDKGGSLDADERALASKVLGRLHRPSEKGMESLLTVLDYLDMDENKVLDHQELTLAVDILDLFCKADSVNDTLSNKELDMLVAVLKHMDSDHNGRLDPPDRHRLRDQLWDPNAFLAEQKQKNPYLQKILRKS